MADEVVPPEQPVRWEWRYALGVCVLAFNGAVIWWCLLYGRSENLLHQNAMSWAFIGSMMTLAGLGFGAALPLVQGLWGKK